MCDYFLCEKIKNIPNVNVSSKSLLKSVFSQKIITKVYIYIYYHMLNVVTQTPFLFKIRKWTMKIISDNQKQDT